MDKLRRRRASAFIIPKDGGWGWVVCLASLWTNGTIFGIINSFGVMYEKIYEEIEGANNFKLCELTFEFLLLIVEDSDLT